MNFFSIVDPFQIVPGDQPIVVGAPHHGTRPHVNADLVTGPIALTLARLLNARAVVVSDMRRTVDVNKNPRNINKRVRNHAFRYQNEVFHGLPRLVIEIHGHASGHYPVEITSGFDLDPDLPGDAMFLMRLSKVKQNLPVQLSGKVGRSVGVGVYPLDRDVKKTATNTYTFQKVRRARNRAGMEWYGLHIELSADLRLDERGKARADVDSLAEALAAVIIPAFIPLPGLDAAIPTHIDINGDELDTGILLRVMKAPEDSIGKNMVFLHPTEANRLGFFEGDLIPLANHGEVLKVPVACSAIVPPMRIAIPARVRRQLDLNPGDSVKVFQPSVSQSAKENFQSFVIGSVRAGTGMQVWMHPSNQGQAHGEKGYLQVQGPINTLGAVPAQVGLDEQITMERMVVVSDGLMNKLMLTIGDILMIEVKV